MRSDLAHSFRFFSERFASIFAQVLRCSSSIQKQLSTYATVIVTRLAAASSAERCACAGMQRPRRQARRAALHAEVVTRASTKRSEIDLACGVAWTATGRPCDSSSPERGISTPLPGGVEPGSWLRWRDILAPGPRSVSPGAACYSTTGVARCDETKIAQSVTATTSCSSPGLVNR